MGKLPLFATTDLSTKGVTLGSLVNSFWRDVRYYYDSSTVMYICKSTVHKSSVSVGDKWHIWKITMDASGNVTRTEGPLIGNVNQRASLGWGV